MKELYQEAKMELVTFSAVDVITSSTTTSVIDGVSEWVPRENEGAPCSWWNY